MNPIAEFFVDNFALLCVSIGLVFMVVQNYESAKKQSTFTIGIIISSLLLAVLKFLETYSQDNNIIVLATICAFLGYSIRPICLYLFIRLAEAERNKVYFIFILPLIINVLVYSTSLFFGVEAVQRIAFYFETVDGVTYFKRGTILNFFSHLQQQPMQQETIADIVPTTIIKTTNSEIKHARTVPYGILS